CRTRCSILCNSWRRSLASRSSWPLSRYISSLASIKASRLLASFSCRAFSMIRAASASADWMRASAVRRRTIYPTAKAAKATGMAVIMTITVADIGLTSFKGRLPLLCGRERSGSHNAEKAERKRPGLRNTVSTRHTTGRRETYTVVTDIGLYAPSLWLYEDKAQQLPGLLGGNCP